MSEEQVQEKPDTVEGLISSGYVVGFTDEGKIICKVINTPDAQVNIIELFGFHKYAGIFLQEEYETLTMRGDARVHEVGKAVAALNQKIDQLLPTPPEEKDAE